MVYRSKNRPLNITCLNFAKNMRCIFKQHPITLFSFSLLSLHECEWGYTIHPFPSQASSQVWVHFFHPVWHRAFYLFAASALLTAAMLLDSPFSDSHLSIGALKLQMQREATSFVCQEKELVKSIFSMAIESLFLKHLLSDPDLNFKLWYSTHNTEFIISLCLRIQLTSAYYMSIIFHKNC